ncbi:alpha-1,6-glucosidase domain-containing protein, partial [Klebsiella pneumoniae]|uniref:alpha-1,6-glucosidase domain-containing protein n=1 Tax=Klebsiella pneumoniae TaxID=573 RepID=UPI0030D7C6EC
INGILVEFKAAPESRMLQHFAGKSLQLSAIQQAAGDRSLASGVQVAADGSVTLPAWSVAVLELPQGESQGAGLPVSSK